MAAWSLLQEQKSLWFLFLGPPSFVCMGFWWKSKEELMVDLSLFPLCGVFPWVGILLLLLSCHGADSGI